MSAQQPLADAVQAQRREFLAYAAGLVLAFTGAAFALVRWQLLARGPLLTWIGVLALAQVVVHFRCFLHIGLKRKREDLLLILFSTVMLFVMVAGTIWIMADLAPRMAIPMAG